MTTHVKANASVHGGRVKVEFALGFGHITIDIEQEALGDDDKLDLLVAFLETADDSVLKVFEALIDKAEEVEA